MLCAFQLGFSPYLVRANKNDVRPDIKIQGETTMTARFLLAPTLAMASLMSNRALGADPPSRTANDMSVPRCRRTRWKHICASGKAEKSSRPRRNENSDFAELSQL